MRIGGRSQTAPNEIDYLRDSNEKAIARAGSLYVHWRRYSFEWNIGECRRCFYENDFDNADPRCDVCYGTGWEYGYSRPSIQWMIVNDAQRVFQVASTGFLETRSADSYSPALPRISPEDVLAYLVYRNGVWTTGDRFVVDSTRVREIRARDQVDSLRHGTDDHLDFEPEVVAYLFNAQLIPKDIEENFLRPEYRLPTENPVWLADPLELISTP